MAEISGVELASVYLSLVPSLRGAEKAIADQIAAVPMARPAAALGGSLARGIGTGLRKSAEIGVAITSISTRMGASIASTLAADAGRKIGRVLQSSGIMQPIQQRMAKINEFITKRAASARDSFLGGVVRTAGKVPTSLMAMMADAQSAMGRGWQKLTAGAGAAFSGITQRIAGVGNAAAGAIARGAGAAVAAAGRLGSQMAAAITSSVKVGTAAIAGLVAANVDRAIDRVDVMTTFPKAMQNLGYSAEDSAAAINKISAGLNGLPTATNDLAGFVKRIVPTTSGLDEAAEVGLAFNNMLLAGGGALQEQSSAMEQFAQMLAVGKVDMVGFRAVMQTAPGQLDQLAASMLGAGAKGMDLYDAMMAGTITISDFNQALVKASREGGEGFTAFADQAKNASGGIRTAMGRMNTAVARGIAKVIEAIGPERIGNAFAAVGGAIEKVLTGIASLINGSGSGPGMAGLLPIGGAILGVLGGMASQLPFIGALFQGITGPVGLVVGLLGAMFVKSQPLRDALSGVGEAFGAVFATLGPAMRWILKTFEALAVELAGPLADAITTAGEPLAHLFGTT